MKNFILLSVLFTPLCLAAQAEQPTSTIAENSSQMTINVRLDVPIVQQNGNNCWEASLAMILSWRQQASTVPEDITGDSEFWQQWCIEGGLDPEHDQIFRHYHLTVDRAYQSYTPEDYARILQERGPIWVGTDVSSEGSTEAEPHAMVITGIAGDGTPNGTIVYMNNPWGRTEQLRFQRFEQFLLARLVRSEAGFTRDETGNTTGHDPNQRFDRPVYFVYP